MAPDTDTKRDRPTFDDYHQPIYDWLTANNVDEWLPEYPAIVVDHAARTVTYTAFVWDGPRGWDAAHVLVDGQHDVVTERRTVPLLVEPDATTTLRIAHMTSGPRPVGYVDLAVFANVDGDPIPVGSVAIPVLLSAPANRAQSVQDIAVRAHAGTPQIDVPVTDHPGCPTDVRPACYIVSADERIEIGSLVCCAECQPGSDREASPPA